MSKGFDMIKWFFRLAVYTVLFLGIGSCQDKKVPLDEEQFTTLLLDMHKVDGVLAVNKEYVRNDDLKNYAYYNELFKKYDITRTDFDSCMHYYSAQIDLFAKMYDVVIDSLNKDLTSADRILNQLKANDSISYFPIRVDTIRMDSLCIVNTDTLYVDSVYTVLLDTIRLDSVYTLKIDSILPGLYKFSTKLQFDSIVQNNYRRIASFFTSSDGKDTLRVRNIVVTPDTLVRTYNWSQYVDSIYTQLVICYMEEVPLNDRPKIYKNRKWIKSSKKDKAINLEKFGGRAFDNELLRPYTPRRTEKRLQESLVRQR